MNIARVPPTPPPHSMFNVNPDDISPHQYTRDLRCSLRVNSFRHSLREGVPQEPFPPQWRWKLGPNFAVIDPLSIHISSEACIVIDSAVFQDVSWHVTARPL